MPEARGQGGGRCAFFFSAFFFFWFVGGTIGRGNGGMRRDGRFGYSVQCTVYTVLVLLRKFCRFKAEMLRANPL